jgi:hypothetical protein
MKMFVALILALAGVLLGFAAWSQADWPPMGRFLLALIAALFLFYAAMLTLQWALEETVPIYDDHIMRSATAAAITPESERLRAIASMTPYQVEAWLRMQTTAVAVPGVAGAMLMYDVDGEMIPAEFVHEFLTNCGTEYLHPVRRYAEGTKGRDWAQRITQFYVTKGLARPAYGNVPAQWHGISKQEALGWFSLIEDGEGDEI